MQSLFNYQTLKCSLIKKTRTLKVSLNKDENENFINLEMLFELESLFSWVSARVEINSIYITSPKKVFSEGFDTKNLEKFNENQIVKINNKLQKIVYAMMHLPQTIIIDLKDGAKNLGCELAIGADLRIANSVCDIAFNHPKLGLTAGAGGLGLLTSIVGQLNARNWLLSGKRQKVKSLINSGFLFDTYKSLEERDFIIEELLENINEQASVARIQTKLGILSPFVEQFKSANKLDQKISKATLITGDWKSIEEPMKAKSMSYAAKLSLVKNEDELPN